jgi:hypothetical protein
MFKRPRKHNPKHLEFVRQLPCAVCGDPTSTEAAHVRSAHLKYGKRPTGMGEKPDDRWTVPLCGAHHREQHSMNEMEFWRREGIDPFTLAMSLEGVTGEEATALNIIALHKGKQ